MLYYNLNHTPKPQLAESPKFLSFFMVSTLGANAVAAVGLTTQPKFLGLALFIAANVAISALVARRFGEKRQQAANEILVMTICFCIVAAVIISALTVGFADQVSRFLFASIRFRQGKWVTIKI